MPRIAMCGVFDIPNYGDHLFPQVLECALVERKCDCEVILFSAFKAVESFVENSMVHSVDSMEKMHLERPFDAIVVGGGEIIHWHKFQQKMTANSEEFVEYPMAKIWLTPFVMKQKYGIPVLWNAPGIPFDFEDSRELANCIFSNVDYLSVRNDFSKQVLLNNGIEDSRISVAPDSGFLLNKISSETVLREQQIGVFPDIGKYIVFHCNRFISEGDVQAVVSLLSRLHDRGYEIVLLPLAYTHGDESILGEIKAQLPFEARMPNHVLSLLQILGVLANCELYVGTSLHGSVTSAVYGKKVVSFDYQQTKKTRDLYQLMNYEEYYVTDGSRLETVVIKALREQQPVDFHDIQEQVDKHFDSLITFIMRGDTSKYSQPAQVSVITNLIQDHFEKRTQTFGLIQRIDELHTALQTNIDLVQIYKSQVESFSQEIDALRTQPWFVHERRKKITNNIKRFLHPVARIRKAMYERKQK